MLVRCFGSPGKLEHQQHKQPGTALTSSSSSSSRSSSSSNLSSHNRCVFPAYDSSKSHNSASNKGRTTKIKDAVLPHLWRAVVVVDVGGCGATSHKFGVPCFPTQHTFGFLHHVVLCSHASFHARWIAFRHSCVAPAEKLLQPCPGVVLCEGLHVLLY